MGRMSTMTAPEAISPGRSMEVEGRIGRHGGDRIIYNPRYQLLP